MLRTDKMIDLTKNEQEALLIMYKDIYNFYNANSLSKIINLSQVGTRKILKKLEKNKILFEKKIGNSIVYKLNIMDEFVQKLIMFALINESRKHLRWKEEFKALNESTQFILFYGSASRDYSSAKDIDILLMLKKEDFSPADKIINHIGRQLPKKIHDIKATKEEIIKNLKEKNKAMLEIIRTAVVLNGYENYMEILNGFASF